MGDSENPSTRLAPDAVEVDVPDAPATAGDEPQKDENPVEPGVKDDD